MQIKRILAALTLLLAIASLSANATVKVNNLFLVKSGQFTELTIACDGKCDFTHQIVEEAANKPYRIVVDIKDAVHGLPQHAFANLPAGMVQADSHQPVFNRTRKRSCASSSMPSAASPIK